MSEVIFYGTVKDDTRIIRADKAEMRVRVKDALAAEGVEKIEIKQAQYDPSQHDGCMPWDLPGFERHDDLEEEEDDAYGRKELDNWKDIHVLWVNEDRKKLSVNENFRQLQGRCGAHGRTIVGPMVMQRWLCENGCGDTVRLPVSAAVLAGFGLHDPRDREL